MASIEKECNHAQGFEFKEDEQHRVGFISSLSIGDVIIPADILVTQPSCAVGRKDKSAKAVVAVLSNVTWEEVAPTKPLRFEGRISRANKQIIQALMMKQFTKVAACMAFSVYEYDRIADIYFKSFSSYQGVKPIAQPGMIKARPGRNDSDEKPIFGNIGASVGKLKFTINDEEDDDIPGFISHQFTFTLSPTAANKTQQLLVQTSVFNKQLKGFGLPVA